MRPLNHEVTTLQSLLLGIGGKFLYRILLLQIFLQLVDALELAELRTVLVRIFKGILYNQSTHGSLFVVGCHVGGVLGDKNVGSNTTAAIYRSADGGLISRSLVFDAILREKFSVLITRHEVFFVILVAARCIMLLNAATRRRIVAGDGQTNHRLVIE